MWNEDTELIEMSTPLNKADAASEAAAELAKLKEATDRKAAQLVELCYELNKEQLREDFPNVPMEDAEVATLTASDKGPLARTLVTVMEKRGVTPARIICDPARKTVTVILEKNSSKK